MRGTRATADGAAAKQRASGRRFDDGPSAVIRSGGLRTMKRAFRRLRPDHRRLYQRYRPTRTSKALDFLTETIKV
jgi:hypothetical protein